MKFVSVRDFRSKSGKVWGDLAREKDLLLTSNGKPIALVSAVSEEDVEESLAALRQVRAMTAVERMQSRSVEKGTDKLSLKEINAEISAVRKERKR
ncbi:MAG TPA: type II toxin-antitoxin system Phd/YefM family antitoxin [bacterium]|nr:type II toxin-antitoxin system Phd/YefM family antitoxin [bacterium]